MNDQNEQYRRPQLHFSDEKTDVRPTINRRQLLSGCAMLTALAVLLIVGLAPHRAGAPGLSPDAAQVRTDPTLTLSEDCQVIQHLTFTPCGHAITRRQTLPAELTGKGRIDLEAAYDAWQLTSFESGEVVMEQAVSMFCPQHVVLMPDEGGMLCIWQNRYGDALALVKQLDSAVGELPESVQQEVRQGKGFDSQDALEQWLESVES